MKTKEITTIAVFAALWGAIEISLGTFLHMIKAPFIGALMASIGAFILLIARSAVPRAGSTTLIGFITAIIKLFAAAGFKIMPSAGIFMESALVDIAVSVCGLNAFSYCLGSALAVSSTVLQNFIGVVLILGKGVDYFAETIKYNFERLGMAFKVSFSAVMLLVTVKIVICAILGVIVGSLAWKISGRMTNQAPF